VNRKLKMSTAPTTSGPRPSSVGGTDADIRLWGQFNVFQRITCISSLDGGQNLLPNWIWSQGRISPHPLDPPLVHLQSEVAWIDLFAGVYSKQNRLTWGDGVMVQSQAGRQTVKRLRWMLYKVEWRGRYIK